MPSSRGASGVGRSTLRCGRADRQEPDSRAQPLWRVVACVVLAPRFGARERFLARGIEGLAVEPSTGVRDGLDVAGRDGVDGVVDVDVDINSGATGRSSDGAAAATEPMRFELSTKPRRILPQPPSGSNRRLWDRVIALILSSDANTARLVIHRDAIA